MKLKPLYFMITILFIGAQAMAQEKLKIYISADMEGVVGAVTGEQLGPSGFEYNRFREFMTQEVNAAIAGHFNVPVIMISGDDAIVEEAKALLGDVEGAVVKWAYGFHSAKTQTPEAAYDLIRAKVKQAIARIEDFKPFKLDQARCTDQAGHSFQKLSPLGSLGLFINRRKNRCSQHKIYRKRHGRSGQIS